MSVKPLTSLQSDSLREATTVFAAALAGSPGEEYLAGRGIGLDVAAELQLGYVTPGTDLPGMGRFAGRVCVPNLNARGKPVGLKFRATSSDAEPKFDAPAGQVARLYNLAAMSRVSDYVAIVEGEFDAITLTALGVPAVAVPGAQAWKGHHWRIFEGIERVVVFYDDDAPGKGLLKTIQRHLQVAAFTAPGGCKDVNEAYMAGHGARLVELATGVAGKDGTELAA